MTITFTEKEFFDLVKRIRLDTTEDAIEAVWTQVSMSQAQADEVRKDVQLKDRSPYSYLLKYNGQI